MSDEGREYRVVFPNGSVTNLQSEEEAVRWAAMYDKSRIEYRCGYWLPIFPAAPPSPERRRDDVIYGADVALAAIEGRALPAPSPEQEQQP